jgi:menaquinone-dependent protoporphyrinogen oxidase
VQARALIDYGTKYGATAEIASKIGQVLSEAGLLVDVLPAGQVCDLSSYDVVVLGSAVYAGQWRKEAAALLTGHERALTERPVWLFSSGPTGEGDPVQLMQGWRLPAPQQAIADRMCPCDVAVFHGRIDPDKLSLPERLIVQRDQGADGRLA